MRGVEPGLIRIRARLSGGVVAAAAVTSSRPLSLASAFAGRPVSDAAAALASLHGLCGQSHAAGITLAARAAGGRPVPAEEIRRWVTRLAAERVAEHLRALSVPAAADRPFDLVALRSAVALAGETARRGGLSAEAAGLLGEALDRLGLSPADASEADAPDPAVDRLTAADDPAVIAALAADPSSIRTPSLPGRTPETGPAARRGRSAGEPGAAEAARRAEVTEAAAVLLGHPDDPLAGGPGAWISAGSAGASAGYAAVETPRGRLHTRVVVQGDGRLLDARVLAPTEWNFHPRGPMVRSLVGMRPGADAATDVSRLVAAFDPCVAFTVEVEEGRDA